MFEVEGYDRYHKRKTCLALWQTWMDDRPELSVSEGRTVLSDHMLKVGQEHDIPHQFSDSRYSVLVAWIQIYCSD